MQERVDTACRRRVIAVEIAVRILEQRMIFGMQADYRERALLERTERFAGPLFFPGVEKELARLIP